MSAEVPQAGLTWGAYVEQWVAECGGWLPLADQLIHRAGDIVEIGLDPQTVERGLRRLSRRQHKEGGQYGRWMLRFFGFTQPTEQWVKWMGIYHTRFSDLAVGLRLQQLALWHRPPITEAPLACWLEVGTASAHYARLDLAACDLWLKRAERHVIAAGTEAQLEVGLIRAQLAAETGDHASADRGLVAVDTLLASAGLPVNFAASYRARVQHQRALALTRTAQPDFERVRVLYTDIPDSMVPFVRFRKSAGLAYCAWKLGDVATAVTLAEHAVEAAGDGGLVRMRVMALNMLSRVLEGPQAIAVNERARRMAEALDDEDLRRRVAQSVP